jgi:uncharacterized protein (TIGR03067 family)
VNNTLPARPNLEHLKGQAKRLLEGLAAGDAQVAKAFIAHLPAAKTLTPRAVQQRAFRLSAAQSVLARQLGFASWPSLVRHVEQLRSLEGTWRIEGLQVDGTAFAANMLEHSRILFDGDRFRLESPEGDYEGIFAIDTETKPKAIDIRFVAGPEAGNTCYGIFELDGSNAMTLCLGLVGSPRPKNFASSPGSGHALERLQRMSSSRPEDVKGGEPPEPLPDAPNVSSNETAAFDSPLTPALVRLQGVWTPLELTLNGKAAPAPWLASGSRTMRGNELEVVFGGQKMVHARVRIDDTKDPIEVDYLNLSGKQQGTLTLGIMQWQGNEVDFLMAPNGAPRPANWNEKKGTRTRWRRQ